MPDYDFFSDEQLVKAARDGEDAAWEALLRRHGQRLLAFFTRMNGGDLGSAQAQWLNLWSELARQRPSLASGPRFSTTAFGQAVKISLAEAPVKRRLPNAEPSSLEMRSASLSAGLADLPPVERAALCLGYFDNLPFDEIGRILGCRSDEAKSLCATGYGHLDAVLGSDFLSVGL